MSSSRCRDPYGQRWSLRPRKPKPAQPEPSLIVTPEEAGPIIIQGLKVEPTPAPRFGLNTWMEILRRKAR